MRKIKFIGLGLVAFFILAILILWILYALRNIETSEMDAAARKDVPGRFISLSGGVTHYEIAGADTGKTVILVHGYSVPYYIWDNIFDSLVRNGYHVVRYDEFGRGYSDRLAVDYLPALYREQLYDLIYALQVKTPVSLMGVSFGGAVTTDFVVHHPDLVDKLVLVDPVFHFKKPGGPEFINDFILAGHHEEAARGQLDDFKYPGHFPGWVERYKIQMRYKGFRHALISTSEHYAEDTIMANYRRLDSLKKNILLIWGRDDKTVPFVFSDSLRKRLHVQFFPVTDAAHLPYLEQPALVTARMISFLKE